MEIGNAVESIGSYAFYDLLVAEFIFEEGSSLKTLDPYALSHLHCWVDGITFPKSLETWSKYVLTGGNFHFILFVGCPPYRFRPVRFLLRRPLRRPFLISLSYK